MGTYGRSPVEICNDMLAEIVCYPTVIAVFTGNYRTHYDGVTPGGRMTYEKIYKKVPNMVEYHDRAYILADAEIKDSEWQRRVHDLYRVAHFSHKRTY